MNLNLGTVAPLMRMPGPDQHEAFRTHYGRDLCLTFDACALAQVTTAGGGPKITFGFWDGPLHVGAPVELGRLEWFVGIRQDGQPGNIHPHFHRQGWASVGDRPLTIDGYRESTLWQDFVRDFFVPKNMRMALHHNQVGDVMFAEMDERSLRRAAEDVIKYFCSAEGQAAYQRGLRFEDRPAAWVTHMEDEYHNMRGWKAA